MRGPRPQSPVRQVTTQQTGPQFDITYLKTHVRAVESRMNIYNPTGTVLHGTPKEVRGSVNIVSGGTATINLTPPASFSLATSYTVHTSMDGSAAPTAPAVVFNQKTTSFQIKNLDGNTRNVQWHAKGT